jgi:membrane associated rhomboid family serine protease
MLYIVIGTGIVFAFDWLFPDLYISSHFVFNRDLFLSGQLWRMVSFILLPLNNNPIFILISMYFYWMVGSALENRWGAFRFNVFYLLGLAGALISGFITGYATNYYLNMSLFLAFALLFPNMEILLFFIIPVKVKYLGIVFTVVLLFGFVTAPLWGKAAILAAFANLGVFFGGSVYNAVKLKTKYRRRQRNFRIQMSTRRDEDDDEK